MGKKTMLFGAMLLGAGIGAFPLLTGSSSTPAAILAEEERQPAVVSTAAPARVGLSVNGVHADQSAVLFNNAAYIPVRLLEQFGGNVRWDEQARKVLVEMEP